MANTGLVAAFLFLSLRIWQKTALNFAPLRGLMNDLEILEKHGLYPKKPIAGNFMQHFHAFRLGSETNTWTVSELFVFCSVFSCSHLLLQQWLPDGDVTVHFDLSKENLR